MEKAQAPVLPGSTLGTTALGRLEMRVPEEDGYEEVSVERRWPDMVAARSWCERIVRRAAPGTAILEIQVFEEHWRHAKSWETTGTRPVAQVLQLGVVNNAGFVHWSEPRAMTARSTARQAH